MNIKKNLKRIIATAVLGATVSCACTNADVIDKIATIGGILGAIDLIPRALYNKSGTQWLMDKAGYKNGLLNSRE